MVERFDSYAHALRDRFDVVLQCRLGIRVAKMRLHVLDARELKASARASETTALTASEKYTACLRRPCQIG